MKYVVSWREREASPREYEAAQKNLIEVFKDFKLPKDVKINQCLIRAGEFSGYLIFETDADETDHLGRILAPVFDKIHNQFRVDFQRTTEPVVDVTDAVVAYVT